MSAHPAPPPPWPRCELCAHLRPPEALEKYGTALRCKDARLCCALRTKDVGPDGLQPRPGPNDTAPEETPPDATPPHGRNGVPH